MAHPFLLRLAHSYMHATKYLRSWLHQFVEAQDGPISRERNRWGDGLAEPEAGARYAHLRRNSCICLRTCLRICQRTCLHTCRCTCLHWQGLPAHEAWVCSDQGAARVAPRLHRYMLIRMCTTMGAAISTAHRHMRRPGPQLYRLGCCQGARDDG